MDSPELTPTSAGTGISPLEKELSKRLTFAIISHPDAGKTTITEKLLFFGGAIHMAGAVKSKKNARGTVSDFMKMEQERGISISTSVMGFDYRERRVNLLDTPGHADFSEDTYRTLTAVDSTLMVIDSVKGVEERTRKLCEICRMRKTPIITFLNKFDREGKEPIELLDEVESELFIKACPMSWPVGQGRGFRGVYSIYEKRLILFDAHGWQDEDSSVEIRDLNDPVLEQKVGKTLAEKLKEELELVQGVYPVFDRNAYLEGTITPLFFGSALNNFGVRELLDCFVDIAPPPVPRQADEREVKPSEQKFSGLVFKIHANLDPKHRDRIAFLRICSGTFERNKMYHHVRTGKSFRSSNPTAFMAQNREIIDEAYPGDIIGLHDTGTLKIGDTITEGETLHFTGIPSFSPQIFNKVINLDPLKGKQLAKGLEQLSEEGVVQLFTKETTNEKVLGVVGQLQFEVIKYRLEEEYKAVCRFEPVEYGGAVWIDGPEKALDNFLKFNMQHTAFDKDKGRVYMYRNEWALERTRAEYKDLKFFSTSEMDHSA
ncbi:MAG: peptide chain release factor 3 [Spirochaetales bacterium]|nr:peptide chain release factor 3 [Spirochaetales bacterium]